MSADAPRLAIGINERAITISPEHVRRGHGRLGPGVHRTLVELIDIFDVEKEAAAVSAQGLGRFVPHVRDLVSKKNDGVAYFQFGVGNLAIRARHAHQFFGAQRLLVERDGFGGIADGKGWGDGVEALGNFIYGSGHRIFSFGLR